MYKNRMNTIMYQLEEVERERDQVEQPFDYAIYECNCTMALVVYIV